MKTRFWTRQRAQIVCGISCCATATSCAFYVRSVRAHHLASRRTDAFEIQSRIQAFAATAAASETDQLIKRWPSSSISRRESHPSDCLSLIGDATLIDTPTNGIEPEGLKRTVSSLT
jgi:hypothetical protein